MNSEKVPVCPLPASTNMNLLPLSSSAAVELHEMLHGKPDRIELPGNAHYPQETLIMGNIPESVVYVEGDSLTSVDTTGKCATIPTPDHLLTFHRYEQDIGCDIAVVVMDGIRTEYRLLTTSSNVTPRMTGKTVTADLGERGWSPQQYRAKTVNFRGL